jgi:hypothetical protein
MFMSAPVEESRIETSTVNGALVKAEGYMSILSEYTGANEGGTVAADLPTVGGNGPDWLRGGADELHAWFASTATLAPSAKSSLIRFTEVSSRMGFMADLAAAHGSVSVWIQTQEGSERW